ncbi:CRISPR-associated protein Csx16 [Paenibacillus medicaginis]|uniref:CRISPR-associated protein Csx16 n=1 Tax=Paenibacillus medicaginis TaxID=1470560 RepID=A0ABV5C465_9BACL
MKLSQLLANKKVIASGFAAIVGLSTHSRGAEEVVLSSLAPSVLAEQGVTEYYALELTRGTVYNTTEEIIAADLDVRKYQVEHVSSVAAMELVIVSRHKGTVDLLIKQFGEWTPAPQVLEAVTPEQITGKYVVGTLPPHLIATARAYTAVTIKGFDHTKDGDTAGSELAERLIIADKPLRVVELQA